MWPPFCLTTSCKRTLAFVTTFRHKSSESARHNFTMWALSCLFLMKNMFNVTTVLPHNLLQTNPCIRHNFLIQVFRKRAAQLHNMGPELRYILWPPKEARKCSAAQGPHCEVVPRAFWRLVSKSCDECKRLWSKMVVTLNMFFIRNNFPAFNSVPDVKCLVIIKMCYVHNQWYDIPCATLYIWTVCSPFYFIAFQSHYWAIYLRLQYTNLK